MKATGEGEGERHDDDAGPRNVMDHTVRRAAVRHLVFYGLRFECTWIDSNVLNAPHTHAQQQPAA